MGYRGIERRRYRRMEGSFMVSFSLREEDKPYPEAKWNISSLRNISAAGILFTLDESLPVGSTLKLRIRVPFIVRAVECLGVVTRNREVVPGKLCETAVEFIEIDREVKEVISNRADPQRA